MNVRKLLCELTAEEKAALVAGHGFYVYQSHTEAGD